MIDLSSHQMSLLFRPKPLLKRLNPFDYFISTSQVSITCFGYRSDYPVPEVVKVHLPNQGDSLAFYHFITEQGGGGVKTITRYLNWYFGTGDS